MFGRAKLFGELCRHLTKATPDHMCVVGPPLFGKSVLLNHLGSHFKDRSDHYVTSLYWDLRHSTPTTDDEFRRNLAQRVKEALEPTQPDFAAYLEPEEEELRDLLQLVFDDLASSGMRLLAVLDGFDHVLASSGITRNLWDEMRTLGQKTSLRLVTGSRSRLRELCKTEDSRTSDFWEIFYDTPLQVGCFEDDDWAGFLGPAKSRAVLLDGSALKEVKNWTGGVPVLATALADQLLARTSAAGLLTKSNVDQIGDDLVEERRDLLAALWDDCSIELRSDLVAVANGDVPLSEVPDQRRRDLELRGFARSSGNKLRSSCRLMTRYAHQQGAEVGNLQRLFGSVERFDRNIRSLLELRLTQIRGMDPELTDYVRRAIRDLHPKPATSVVWARNIAERGLKLIWEAELGPDRSLPDDWKPLVSKLKTWELPSRLGPQCYILRQITGTSEHNPVSKFISKPTYLLIDHLQSVGDFGQHQGDNTVTLQFAAAFCLSAIALCDSLARDLATPRHIAPPEGE